MNEITEAQVRERFPYGVWRCNGEKEWHAVAEARLIESAPNYYDPAAITEAVRWKRCGTCEGEGQYRLPTSQVVIPPDNTVTCRDCNGTGQTCDQPELRRMLDG